MNWLIFSLLTAFFFALSTVIARAFLKKQGDALAFTAIHDFIAGAILLPVIFINFSLPTHNITWLFFIGLVIFALLSDWSGFVALKLIDVSLFKIVWQSRHILVLLAGFLFFAESITLVKVSAVLLIIIGVIIALYEKAKVNWSKGITFTILSTVFGACAIVFAKFAIKDFSANLMASLELMLIGILIFTFLKFKPKTIIKEFKVNKWGLILAGGFFGISELFMFMSLKIGEVSKVVPVVQSSLVFAVLMGIIFLKEYKRIPQKIIGMLVIVIGVLLLYHY
ncbi:DMT family transporter [Patescibacteria group bacterium]|nr:DMT family transporter [Patescibacteria group bacterium]